MQEQLSPRLQVVVVACILLSLVSRAGVERPDTCQHNSLLVVVDGQNLWAVLQGWVSGGGTRCNLIDA